MCAPVRCDIPCTSRYGNAATLQGTIPVTSAPGQGQGGPVPRVWPRTCRACACSGASSERVGAAAESVSCASPSALKGPCGACRRVVKLVNSSRGPFDVCLPLPTDHNVVHGDGSGGVVLACGRAHRIRRGRVVLAHDLARLHRSNTNTPRTRTGASGSTIRGC